MTPAVIIALIAAIPGTVAAFIQYRNRSMNPKENGVDWVVHRYREMAEEALLREQAERDRANRLAAELEVERSNRPKFPHQGDIP